MRLDLHLHSRASPDSNLRPTTIARLVQRAGLDGVAITDHWSTRSVRPLRAEFASRGLTLIPGEEVRVVEDGRQVGELLVWFSQERIGRQPLAVILDAVRDQDALLAIPHPYDPWRRGFALWWGNRRRPDWVCAVESRNGHQADRRLDRDGLALARRWRVATVGGSDAHGPAEIGTVWTEFPGDDLREALKSRSTRARGRARPWQARLAAVRGQLIKRHLWPWE